MLPYSILKTITPCAEERSGYSCIASPFSCGLDGPQEKGAGYAKLRSDHTRLEELQLKEVNTQIFPAVEIELAKYAANKLKAIMPCTTKE